MKNIITAKHTLSTLFLLWYSAQVFSQTISGQVRTETGSGIEEATVSVTGPGISLFDLTDNNGNFEFTGLPTGQSYELCVELDNNPLNGVSTFDQVLLAKHILHTELLDSPYKIIAGEVGGDNTPPDVLDLYITRQLILGVYTEFPSVPSWKFMRADFAFPDPVQPYSYPFPLGCKTMTLSGDATGQDFIGMKSADVNGNAVAH